jgi:hypothetical protein
MVMPKRNYIVGNDYRFGFNSQEKSNEIAPNTSTALFWEYDARIARRWNLDPRPNASVSSYSVFDGNPINTTDVLGDTTKFFGTGGNLIYQNNKGEGTVLYTVTQEQFSSLNSKYKNGDKLTGALIKVGIKTYATQDEAAAAWAPGGFAATKSDPSHFERAARIFHAKAFGDQKISDLYIVGSTVTGRKSNEPGVSQETDPTGSMVFLNGKALTSYTQPGVATTYRGNTVVNRRRVIVQSWNCSAMAHTHEPGNDKYSISAGDVMMGGSYGGDFGLAADGISIYLVPTSADAAYRMFRLDLSPYDRKAYFRDGVREAQKYMSREQKIIPLR